MSEGKSPWGSAGGSSGGNNGGRGNNPWGGGGGGNKPPRKPQQPADLDNVIQGFKDKFGGGGGGQQGAPVPKSFPMLVALGVVLLIGSTSFYTVDQQEEAVVLRFGEYQRTASSGLNFKLPSPIETVHKEKTREVKKIDVGGSVSQSEMLTGDENIVDINFSVLWRINDLEDYLFNVDAPEVATRAVAESAMREVIGGRHNHN